MPTDLASLEIEASDDGSDSGKTAARKTRTRERGPGIRQIEELISALHTESLFEARGDIYILIATRNELASTLGLKSRQTLLGRLKRLEKHGVVLNWNPLEIDAARLADIHAGLSEPHVQQNSEPGRKGLQQRSEPVDSEPDGHSRDASATVGLRLDGGKAPPAVAAPDAVLGGGAVAISHYVNRLQQMITPPAPETEESGDQQVAEGQPGTFEACDACGCGCKGTDLHHLGTSLVEIRHLAQKIIEAFGSVEDSSASTFDSSASTFDSSASTFDSSASTFDSSASTFDSSASTFDSSASTFDSSASTFDSSASTFDSSASTFDSSASTFDSSASTFDSSASTFDSSASTFDSSASTFDSSASTFDSSASTFDSSASTFDSSASTFDNVDARRTLNQRATNPKPTRDERATQLENARRTRDERAIDLTQRATNPNLNLNQQSKPKLTGDASTFDNGSSRARIKLKFNSEMNEMNDLKITHSSQKVKIINAREADKDIKNRKNRLDSTKKQLGGLKDTDHSHNSMKNLETSCKDSDAGSFGSGSIRTGAAIQHEQAVLGTLRASQQPQAAIGTPQANAAVDVSEPSPAAVGFAQNRQPLAERDFEQPVHAVTMAAFETLVHDWMQTWPAQIAEKAPVPDVELLHPACSRYPLPWVHRAMKLITRDMRRIGKIRNPGSVLYIAASDGWLRYFPTDPPLLCEFCGDTLTSQVAKKCDSCLESERAAARAEAARAEAAEAEAAEKARQRNFEEIRALNSKLVAEYGITVPGVCRVIKQHQRTDLLQFGLEGAARIISRDPHLRRIHKGPPGCAVCRERLRGGDRPAGSLESASTA